MTEFIGSRISLISKRDIRYVGTLHEISSENSTVALEQVVSYGTEGRRPEDEVPPSDNVYEYIVFRGSDVKDLRIEEPPKENQPPKPPQVPDDPAILGSARRPTPASTPQAPTQAPTQAPPQQPQQPQPQPQPQPQQQRQPQPQHPQFPQQPPFPYYYGPPPNQRFGPQGFPPGPGFPGMPYGAPPPGWYPPPGHGFPPHPGQFHPGQMPIGPPGQQQRQQGPQLPQNVPNGPASSKEGKLASQQPSPAKPVATVKLPSTSTTPIPPMPAQKAPTPPAESKPDVAAALAPPAPAVTEATTTPTTAPSKPVPTGPKSGRIMPAIPLPSPAMKVHVPANGPLQSTSGNAVQPTPSTNPVPPALATRPSQAGTKSIEDANRDARAAVAAAMAKLPPAPSQRKQTDGESAIDNLTKKVNEMRTNDNIRTSRQPGTGGYAAGHRGGGGRGGHRGGRSQQDQQTKKVEVPTTDYDFQSANAKFNKQDLVKEAIASGSPAPTPAGETPTTTTTTNGTSSQDASSTNGSQRRASDHGVVPIPAPAAGYNKTSSFFDNISSEARDRDETGANRLGGREFRSEEQKKNFETFGAGSVDNGFRGGGFRGRGRGRGGYGYGRGRGGEGRGGRGGGRGGVRGDGGRGGGGGVGGEN